MKSFSDDVRDVIRSIGKYYPLWTVDENTCDIWVFDGDWKNDHMQLKNLISAYGYKLIDVVVDEDEDAEHIDDCYTAYYTITREVV